MSIETLSGKKTPWDGLKINEFDIQSYTNLIRFVNQGVEKKDEDGKPISEDDADFMVALGVIALRTGTVWARRHPDTTNIGDPFFTNQAEALIGAHGKRAEEYVERLRDEKTVLPMDKASLLGTVLTRQALLNF